MADALQDKLTETLTKLQIDAEDMDKLKEQNDTISREVFGNLKKKNRKV